MDLNSSKRIADLAMSMPMPSGEPSSEGLALGSPEGVGSGAGGDPLSDMQSLLDTWTERDPSTTAGQYYQDLKAVVDKYARD